MDLGLAGKRVIVTGGTRGIGASIVDGFLAEGADVHFCARNAGEVEARLSSLKAKGYRVGGKACDIADKAAYAAYLAEAQQALGGVDIFVANVSGGNQPGEAGFEAAFNVDLMGAVRGAEAVIPAMAAGKSGSIVLISSIMATEQLGGPSGYGALKAAMVSYGTQLSEVASPHGIRVNSVSPGPIHVDSGFWGDVQRQAPDQYQATAARHPLKRLGTPQEVANAVLFLASPSASWVTGVNLTVDGGFSKRIQF